MTYRPDPKEFFKTSEIDIISAPQTPLLKNIKSYYSEKDVLTEPSLSSRKLKPINYKNKIIQKTKILQNMDFNTSGLNEKNCFLDKNFILSNLSNMDHKRVNTYKPVFTKFDNNNFIFLPKNNEKRRYNINDIPKINFPKIIKRNIDDKNLYLAENNDNNKDNNDIFTNIETNIQNKTTRFIVNDVKLLNKENLTDRDVENKQNNLFINTQIKTNPNKKKKKSFINKTEIKKILAKDNITLYEKHKKLIDKNKIYDYNSHWNGNVINLNDDKQYKKLKKFEIFINKIKNSKTVSIVDV